MRAFAVGLAVTLVAGTAHAQFSAAPAGDLVPGSGTGRADPTVFAPTMLFPMQEIPAFLNSQVWGHGGGQGPSGTGQCDIENFSYPWRDNYCESRSWDMPLCPSGTGHQGQDMRAATCEKDVHPVVAGENGTITNVGNFSVYLTADDGTRFDYLHMSNVQVSVGQEVARGDVLGLVSNEFNGTPTTVHLHFNIRQNVTGVGTVYVPPYGSLINSYQKLLDQPIDGLLEEVSCSGIIGWAYDPGDREIAVDVPLEFDENGVQRTVVADAYRSDLCENLSFCERGIDVLPPLSLFDGLSHAVDATNGTTSLPGSPLAFTCDAPILEGSRRAVDVDAWGLTPFWDEPPSDAAAVDAIPVGAPFPAPALVRIAGVLYIEDAELDVIRPLDERVARAWRLSPTDAVEQELDGRTVGADWPARPVMVTTSDGSFLLDVSQPGTAGSGGTSVPGGPAAADADASGCGCRTVGGRNSSQPWLLVAFGLLGWVRRRGRG